MPIFLNGGKRKCELLRKVQGNTAYFTMIKKDEKNRKKDLTFNECCGIIAKLSQRDGSEEAAESRPREGKELAEGKHRSEAGTKKDLKKSKKVLDKANSM